MFYSNKNKQSFSKGKSGTTKRAGVFDSYFLSNQIFSGNQWDEFNLGTQMTFPTKNILVLGAGTGACVRPLLSSAPLAKLTLVDFDKKALLESRTIVKNHFPALLDNLKFLQSDALAALNSQDIQSQQYDLIVVDLYTSEGYAECLSSPLFYSLVAERLSTRGSVLFNCFGLPSNFDFENPGTALAVAGAHLSSVFKHVTWVPYRRNATLLASQHKPLFYTDLSQPLYLSDKDELILMLNKLRAMQTQAINSHNGNQDVYPTFSEIKQEMSHRWNEFFRANPKLVSVEDMQSKMKQPALGALLLEECMRSAETIAAFAVVIGALAQQNSKEPAPDYSYFLEKVCEFVDYPFCSDVAIHFKLAQACAIAVHPNDKYVRFLNPLKTLVEKILENKIEREFRYASKHEINHSRRQLLQGPTQGKGIGSFN